MSSEIKILTLTLDGNSFLGGLAPDLVGLASSQEAKANQYVRVATGIDFYKLGFKGHITPAQIFSTGSVSNAGITSTPRAVAVDVASATPNIHYILGGLSGTAPKTVLSTSGGYVSSASISAHGGHNFTTMPSNKYWGEDIVFYTANNSSSVATQYIFYSWQDNTDGDVGRMSVDASSPDDDFMTTVPSGFSSSGFLTGVPHRMVEAANKKLYITNGRYLAEYDGNNGASGTINYQAYDLGQGWVITDIRKYGRLLAILSVRSGTSYTNYSYLGESKMTLWDTIERGIGVSYAIPDNFASAIFVTPRNTILAFTFGKNSSSKVFEFNGQTFDLLWESIVNGSAPEPNAIEYYKGLVYWVPKNAIHVMALDLETKGVHQPLVNNDGSSNSGESGFLRNVWDNALFVGGSFGSYKAVYLQPGASGYSSSNCDLRTRVINLPFRSTIMETRVYFSQSVSGYSAQLSLFKNYVSSSIGTAGTDLLNTTITQVGINEYRIDDKTIENVSAFYMNIRVSGQVSISRIEIDYIPGV